MSQVIRVYVTCSKCGARIRPAGVKDTEDAVEGRFKNELCDLCQDGEDWFAQVQLLEEERNQLKGRFNYLRDRFCDHARVWCTCGWNSDRAPEGVDLLRAVRQHAEASS